jgi:hypothetical protein
MRQDILLLPGDRWRGEGEVHISWMNNRKGQFNVFYRSSFNGGSTFSSVTMVNRNLGFPSDSISVS